MSEIRTHSQIKILVVDDREDNLFSIETILEQDNYTIVKANSGRAALKILLHQFDFSLILMDVQMPGMNGLETATLIYQREKLKNIPIIFITAHDQNEELLFKGYQMGGVDYIYKPVNPALLKAKVAVFVELYNKTLQLQTQEKKLLSANDLLQKQIEERKASEQRVLQLNEQLMENNIHLKKVNEELDRFAYVASHDLQEPLRKIMFFSDKIIRDTEVDDHAAKHLKKIINSSNQMQALINDLLRFSRQEVKTEDFTECDLNMVVKESLQELEIEVEKTGAKINISNLPVINAVPALIKQVFYNLLHNAVKFRKKGLTPVISVYSNENHPPENDAKNYSETVPYYKIFVEDNGIGFNAQYTDEIFAVFKRLHSHHEYAGTGVGLSICKKIVEKHKGYITAKSEEGKGSTFIISLPKHI
ncbi:MAG: hybrid sensor histidine kinase/response regulator [Ilyomonas sp.]